MIRGGFFSPQASFEYTSPFGFTALSALVALFSQPAVLKLKEIAETVFTMPQPGANPKLQGSDDNGGGQAGENNQSPDAISPPGGGS